MGMPDLRMSKLKTEDALMGNEMHLIKLLFKKQDYESLLLRLNSLSFIFFPSVSLTYILKYFPLVKGNLSPDRKVPCHQ